MPSLDAERTRFIAVCRRAVRAGMQVSTGGNVSARVAAGRYLVKPSGVALHDLTEADLLVTDGEGNVLEGTSRPTRELGSHLALYATAPRFGGVVHYHAPYATAFAVLGRRLPLLTVHARRILVDVPVVAPAPEGSPELAASLADAFRRGEVKAALLAGHGMIAAGSDLQRAQEIAELVEETARIAHLSAVLRATGESEAPAGTHAGASPGSTARRRRRS